MCGNSVMFGRKHGNCSLKVSAQQVLNLNWYFADKVIIGGSMWNNKIDFKLPFILLNKPLEYLHTKQFYIKPKFSKVLFKMLPKPLKTKIKWSTNLFRQWGISLELGEIKVVKCKWCFVFKFVSSWLIEKDLLTVEIPQESKIHHLESLS